MTPFCVKSVIKQETKAFLLNYDKIQFKMSEAEYMGNLVSSKGLKEWGQRVSKLILENDFF